MAYVIRTRTVTERVEIDEDDSLTDNLDVRAQLAVGQARTATDWLLIAEGTSYEFHSDDPDGCVVAQMSGRMVK